jgi:alcohol dehydrogenase
MAYTKFAMGTAVFMGAGCRGALDAQAALLGGSTALLVTDKVLVRAGVVAKVLSSLAPRGLKVYVFDEVAPDPAVSTVDAGGAMAREKGCDLIVAVGGGSPIDAAKGISVVATNGGSCADYEGMDRYRRAPLPVIAIPTTVGTGSEVTFGAVLTNTATNYKFILYGHNLAPKVALLDPELLVGIPRSVVVPTGMDALTHGIESFLSKGATPQSRPLALEAIRIVSGNIRQAAEHPDDIAVLSNMLYGANIAGIAFACSRLGVVHAMALPLGAFFHVAHGIANAVLLPHGLEYNFGYDNAAYCRIAEAMGEDTASLTPEQGARRAVECVRDLVRLLGVPAGLSALGVGRDRIDDMARDAMKSSHVSANPRPMTQSDVAELYARAM